MRSFFSVAALLPVAIFAAPIETTDDSIPNKVIVQLHSDAPIETTNDLIPNKWIVRLRSDADVTAVVAQALEASSFAEDVVAEHTYSFGDFKGFSTTGSEDLLKSLLDVDGIESYEPDQTVTIGQWQGADLRAYQYGAPYNLARIANRDRGSTTYSWSSVQGTGVSVFVLDTGVYGDHQEFASYTNPSGPERRVSYGPNFSDDPDNSDYNGHGTHVAATVAGLNTGVSKHTSIVAVKVLGGNGSGSLSGILAAIDWVVNSGTDQNCWYGAPCTRGIINMSLGLNGYSQALNDAVNNAVDRGITVVVAAGNNGFDARNISPASAGNACTVGATDENDWRAYYSNFGPIVDIFAPGSNIISAHPSAPNAYQYLSGTSMASPHVAGLAANQFLFKNGGANNFPAWSLCEDLRNIATQNVIQDVGPGSPNLLLYNGLGTGPTIG